MGSYKQLLGMQKSPNRPDQVKPVPEHYEGENQPYRGTETHGVKPTEGVDAGAYYAEMQQDDGPDDVQYVAPDEELEPIAVRVVQKTSRERLSWRAVRFIVGDTPQQILGRHERRKNVRIRVHGALDGDPVYIGNESGLRPYTGYLIPAGTELYPFQSTEEIWAIADAGISVELSIMYDFGVEL